MTEMIPSAWTGVRRTLAGAVVTNPLGPHGNRRRREDRRSGQDRRCGEERRLGLDRRSEQDRRCGFDRRGDKDRRYQWPASQDQRFQGVLRTTATVSHLFSQPLTVIMGHVDLLTMQTENTEVQKRLRVIKDQLGLLTTYLQNLRRLKEFRTVEVEGLTLLDIAATRNEDY
jgi:signal transduction histidine kinase